jgi:hypothetical protein
MAKNLTVLAHGHQAQSLKSKVAKSRKEHGMLAARRRSFRTGTNPRVLPPETAAPTMKTAAGRYAEEEFAEHCSALQSAGARVITRTDCFERADGEDFFSKTEAWTLLVQPLLVNSKYKMKN